MINSLIDQHQETINREQYTALVNQDGKWLHCSAIRTSNLAQHLAIRYVFCFSYKLKLFIHL